MKQPRNCTAKNRRAERRTSDVSSVFFLPETLDFGLLDLETLGDACQDRPLGLIIRVQALSRVRDEHVTRNQREDGL
jgi:hypothetical protein